MLASRSQRRPEVWQARAAANVYAAPAGMLEAIAPDHHSTRSAFALHAGAIRRLRIVVTNQIRFDHTSVAADHVDRRTTLRSPALNRAIDDREVPNARELDAVVISF